ncbi:MAG: carbohydrate ABC transporter permease [Limnochordaceae bacterium]|nr:carbohydrate ABC transporter permease [Limnochordaceae bacterium]
MRRHVAQAGVLLAVAGLCAWILAPFAWLVISSVSTRIELTSVPLRWVPERPHFENYVWILTGGPGATSVHRSLQRSAVNSLTVAGGATIVSLVAGAMASYAFARLRFRGRDLALGGLLMTQLLPAVVIIVPMYAAVRALHLLDTQLALALADVAFILPLTTWVLTGYFVNIPRELEDAARVDGCTRAGALARVVLPLATPGITATGIFAFIIAWNEFFSAFILSSTLRSKTMSVVIAEFSSKLGVDYAAMATAGVLTSLPPVILAIAFQRYIVQGLTAGAVKG